MTSPADAILTLLRAGADTLNVHDTDVDVDDTLRVVTVPLPYVAFRPMESEPDRRRACGTISGESYWFDVMFVGITREQAEAARDRSRVRLDGMRPAHTGSRGTPVARRETSPITKDPVYHAPGGGPLFYGVDRYLVVL